MAKKVKRRPPTRRPAVTKKRKTTQRRKKGMSEGLAENFDLTRSGSPANEVLKGAAAGFGMHIILKNISDPKQKTIFGLLAVAVAIGLKQPGIASGAAGALALSYAVDMDSKKTALAEAVEFFDTGTLSEPLVLDADGNPLVLADGSETYSLSDGLDLSENIYSSAYIPGY